MSQTILVTGATGFVGRHLVAALVAAGFRVRAATRQPDVHRDDVQNVVVGDLAGDVDWSEALDGVHCVVHLAGLAHATGRAPEQYDRVNHRATAMLARAAARSGAKRLVFVSSILAQTGSCVADPITEDRPPAPDSPYGASKLAAERALTSTAIETVILRPPLVYGAGVGGNMKRLVGLARLRLPLPIRAIGNRRSLVAVENLVSAIMHCLGEPRVAGQTLIVADDTPLSLPAMIAALRNGLGRKPGLFGVSPALMGAGARLVGAGGLWDRLAGDLAVSNRKLRASGWVPRIDSAAGLAAMIAGPSRRA